MQVGMSEMGRSRAGSRRGIDRRTLLGIAVLMLLLVLSACGDAGDGRRKQLPPRQSPIPENASPYAREGQKPVEVSGNKSIREMLHGSILERFKTPSEVRWILDFDEPVTQIQWSPLKGFSVTAGQEVHNVTSRGQRRWRVVAGKGHRLFGLGELELVWSPAFGRLSELKRRGLTGWTREWNGRVTGDERGVYLFDASTVAALGPDGKDKWRVALEAIREVDGPFACENNMLVHGMSGMKRVAVEITPRGGKTRVSKLGRGALLLEAGPNCEPLIWREGELKLLSPRGIALWRRRYANAPFVTRLDGGFALISGQAGLAARFEVITTDGRTVSKGSLPVSGRITRADAISDVGVSILGIGFCLDVTHPCAAPGSNRGPYNAFVTRDGKGGFRTMIRHTAGHLGVTRLADGGIITASAKDGAETDLVRRDAHQKVVWQRTIPGRLSAGPYIGPYGAVYIATCAEWSCTSPFRLFAVTVEKPPSEDEKDDN
jgi:hypothetical protein